MIRPLFAGAGTLRLSILGARRRRLCAATTILGAVACGCAPFATIQQLPERRPLGADIAAYEAPIETSARPAAGPPSVEPTGILSLRDALAFALERSPELA